MEGTVLNSSTYLCPKVVVQVPQGYHSHLTRSMNIEPWQIEDENEYRELSFPSYKVKTSPSQHIPLQNLLKSQSLLTLLKLIRLQPQRLSSKLSERSLNPLLRLRILFNRTLRTQPSSQQSSLSTHKQSC